MVDEGDGATEAAAAVTASGEADAPSSASEAEVEAHGGADKSPRGRAASPPPSIGSAGAPRVAGAPQAAPTAGQGVAGAPVTEQERRLEAGSRRASICPPLWKVCLRAPLPNAKTLHTDESCASCSCGRARKARPSLVAFCCVSSLLTTAWFARTLPQVLKPHQVEGVKWLVLQSGVTSTLALILTHDQSPASSTAGDSGDRHPGGFGQLDNLFTCFGR